MAESKREDSMTNSVMLPLMVEQVPEPADSEAFPDLILAVRISLEISLEVCLAAAEAEPQEQVR